MLKDQPWFRYSNGLEYEMKQAEEEGRVIADLKPAAQAALNMPVGPDREKRAEEIYNAVQRAPQADGYLFDEPSSPEAIKALRPKPCAAHKAVHAEPSYDKIYGAWLGRCAGNLLGKPVEGWRRGRLVGFLHATDNFPIRRYMSSAVGDGIKKKYDVFDEAPWDKTVKFAWINTVAHMPEDDDINYTLIGMILAGQYGAGFTPDDAAECWLKRLPVMHVCTAERVAYRNLVNGIYPPASASHCNPFREWVGAQIRGDFFGYVLPGDPEQASELAWRDASVSHVKNGIYGEMFVAAMLAAAAEAACVADVIRAGLAEIPENCRLSHHIRLVLAWHREGAGWQDAIDRIHGLFDETSQHHWCHVVPNAMIVCAALLYGELDFERTLAIAVSAAFDTDSNGATAGSVAGMMLGADCLPRKWIAPLNDTLESGVDGYGKVAISSLAEKTVSLARSLRQRDARRKG